MTKNAQEYCTEKRWATIATLLSMDVVLPFFPLMGLHLDRPNDLMNYFRRCILSARNAHPHGPYISSSQLFAGINSHFGKDAVLKLKAWNEHVFEDDLRDRRHLRNWKHVLRSALADEALWVGLWGNRETAQSVRREFLRSLDQKHYNEVFDEVYSTPLSDWDLHIYAIHLFDDDDEDGTSVSPDTWVHPTCRACQAIQFWTWVLGSLRSDELDSLHANAAKLAETNKQIYVSEPLVHPKQFEVRL